MNSNQIFKTGAMILIVVCMCGCQEDESAVVQKMASQMVHEQAAQNDRLAAATRELVSADAESREEMLATHQNLQQQLQQERRQLDSRKSQLDEMRTEIERDRRQAPIIAQSIFAVGGILGCLAPLLLAAYILYSVNRVSDADQEQIVNQVLIDELTRKNPLLLPAPIDAQPAIADGRPELETSLTEPPI
jgi:hypothetical protein